MKRVCKVPGCLNTEYILPNGTKTGYCAKHQEYYYQYLEKRKEYFQGRYGRNKESRPWVGWYSLPKWIKLRDRKLQEQPICEECKKRLSVEVDHITPHRGDEKLFFDYSNLQTLCKSCHSKKTSKEQIERKKSKKN